MKMTTFQFTLTRPNKITIGPHSFVGPWCLGKRVFNFLYSVHHKSIHDCCVVPR